MQRRRFLTVSLATPALGASARALGAMENATGGAGREYYELRRYRLQSGPQVKLAGEFFRDAFIPGVNRLGIRPVGVFNQVLGPENPTLYVLMPSQSVNTLMTIEARLQSDSRYLKAGAAFLDAPASSPAYLRIESSLMLAFPGRPRLQTPPASAAHSPRTFELRTYESPSDRDHRRKIEMFQSGEFDIFRRAGFWPVFYGDTLIGNRLPNLTYMLAFDSLADRDKLWAAFTTDPQWTRLTHSAKFDFEAIVTNVTNFILSPAPYSQI